MNIEVAVPSRPGRLQGKPAFLSPGGRSGRAVLDRVAGLALSACFALADLVGRRNEGSRQRQDALRIGLRAVDLSSLARPVMALVRAVTRAPGGSGCAVVVAGRPVAAIAESETVTVEPDQRGGDGEGETLGGDTEPLQLAVTLGAPTHAMRPIIGKPDAAAPKIRCERLKTAGRSRHARYERSNGPERSGARIHGPAGLGGGS